jgi:cobalt-zinc-cadmium efflux system membrane fusion protein
MKKQITIIVIAILTSCAPKKNIENPPSIKDAFIENIETAKVVLAPQEQELLLTGKVECNPDKIFSYVPLICGIVEKSHFSLGAQVRIGQPLLDIRSTELSALQAEKITLEAEEKLVERELKAAQAMFDDNLYSEIELLEAKSKLQQIRAALSKIKSDMSVYGSDKGNGIFTIHAPMSGYIVHKKASSGTMISPESDPVFTIADLSEVWVIANVYASNLLCVREGMEVEMNTFSYPNVKFHGKIDVMSQIFDPEARVLKARIEMDNKDLKLKPEMSMLITLKDKTLQPLVAVPSKALIFDDNQYFVVVEEPKGSFIIKNVVPQGHNQETSYIASGLIEGEKVVVKNQLLIYSELKEE